ncbi:MAG: M6 family metalloprotease domain-containing protein [Prevotella sp.]|nr:M6 family metalloprotease domain-containing protein [Prevotella sp.]
MRHRIQTLLLALVLAALQAQAAPALRGPFTVRQPDGTLLTIEQHGDEHHHWTATADGMLVVNTGRGCYVAQISDEGLLTATATLAHEPSQRSAEEQQVAARQAEHRDRFHSQGLQRQRRALGINASSQYLPHTGTPRVLVILAAYQDLDFTVSEPLKAFSQYMHGDTQEDLGNHNDLNQYSVQQYFDACSHGQFVPQFDLVGPVTLPQTMDYYGGTSSTGSDDRFGEFCRDATEAAKPLVTDWSVYDNDGDGTIELVCIIFAGYGQNQGGAASTLWAKASNRNLRLDDQHRIAFFNCCSELFHPAEAYKDRINGKGTFCHEFSHCLGLPDLYATTSSAYVDNQGMESWDIMDYGLYNNNGFSPCLYTAWEQEVMGWTVIEPLSTDSSLITHHSSLHLQPLEEGGNAYKIVNPDNERDYLVMENIQQRGINARALGHGLLVYHVAYPHEQVSMYDAPNNTPGRPAVAVVPAGGLLINKYLMGTGRTYTNAEWRASVAASPFPGTGQVTTLSDSQQLPNFCFNGIDDDGTAVTLPVGIVLHQITETADGTVSLTLADPTGIRAVGRPQASGLEMLYNLLGQRIRRPVRGIFVEKGKLKKVKK